MTTDARLVQSCIAGNRLAQKALFDRYAATLMAVARRYMRLEEEAEDVLAEAWVQIFQHLRQVQQIESLGGWMRKIVANQALMQLRKKRLQLLELEPDKSYPQHNSEPTAEQQLLFEDLLALLDTLPDGCRSIVNLYDIEGFKHREIAEMLGISEGTSKSQLMFGRQKLKEAYLQSMAITPNKTNPGAEL